MRADGRANEQLRRLEVVPDFVAYPEGSVLLAMGHTRVLCNVSIDHKVPPWLTGRGQGWLTAEYAMLPRATHQRTAREGRAGQQAASRSLEISRLIGRSLRAMVDLTAFGERTITVDCDVLQADGGTRTAAITGAGLALRRAVANLQAGGTLKRSPLRGRVGAVSVGLVDGQVLCDLDYDEDSRAQVDLNVVMDDAGRFIELQGTAEKTPFSAEQLQELLRVGQAGVAQLLRATEELR